MFDHLSYLLQNSGIGLGEENCDRLKKSSMHKSEKLSKGGNQETEEVWLF